MADFAFSGLKCIAEANETIDSEHINQSTKDKMLKMFDILNPILTKEDKLGPLWKNLNVLSLQEHA